MSSIEELVEKINRCNKEYREGTPSISDVEFDDLVDTLSFLDPENDYFTKGVQDETPTTRKCTLPQKMASLNKVKSLDAIREWVSTVIGDCEDDNPLLTITPKLDGLSVLYDVEEDKYYTRGDGTMGQDCTEHLKVIGVPIAAGVVKFIRGEVCFTKSSWNEFKEKHPEYKAPRNTATGLLNADFNEENDYKYLSFIPFDATFDSETPFHKDLVLTCIGNNNSFNIYLNDLTEDKLESLYSAWSLLYYMDGLVIDITNGFYRTKTRSNGNPLGSISYKHPSFSETKTTVITGITKSINRRGVVTPTIQIDPVYVSDAMIGNVNGINMNYIDEWCLMPGVPITIVRSGEVIPKIVAVNGVKIPFREEFKKQKDYDKAYKEAVDFNRSNFDVFLNESKQGKMMYGLFLNDNSRCPFCGSELKWDDTHTNLVCDAEKCDERDFQRFYTFFDIMGVENFAEAKFRALFDSGINNIYKVITCTYEDLNVEGWQDSSKRGFLKEMEGLKSGRESLATYFHALGYFKNLGEKIIQKWLDVIGDGYVELINLGQLMTMGKEEFINKYNIPKITGETLYIGFVNYLEYCTIPESLFKFARVGKKKVIEGVLNGVTVVFTGFRDATLENKITENGGVIGSGVSKNTSILVVKDATKSSSKTKKAESLGIDVMDRLVFEKYLDDIIS